jgi:hypothetical protein
MFRMDIEHNRLATLDEGGDARAMTIAKNLLGMDLPLNKIVEATGLTALEVEKLRNTN